MTSGIEIEEDVPGTGATAQLGSWCVARIRFFLNKGDEVVVPGTDLTRFKVGARRLIAGIEKGVVGMQAGGKRIIRVSPHLAYGEKGVPDRIPPNAVLVCHVELLEIANDWRDLKMS